MSAAVVFPASNCRTSNKFDINLGGSGWIANFHEDNLGRAGSKQLPGKKQNSQEAEIEHLIVPIILLSEPGCICGHKVVPKIRVHT